MSSSEQIPKLLSRQATWNPLIPTTDVIERFVKSRYQREHYKCLAECAQHLIDQGLKEQGVQYKIMSRAKEKISLQEKLSMRNEEKQYKTSKEIKQDISDLAGVRIILYMPVEEEKAKVEEVIRSIWGEEVEPVPHPKPRRTSADESQVSGGGARKKKYRPMHLGYRATHYRVTMQDGDYTQFGSYEWQQDDMVEVQVVSALTHAWAEVEHDIVYKSNQYGPATFQEQRILDALGGLVQSGDLLLEQFQEMVNKRSKGKWEHQADLRLYLRELDLFGDLDEPPEFSSDGLEVLFLYLTQEGTNFPITVRKTLQDLGYPKEPKLKEKIADFKPPLEPAEGMAAPLCVLQHLLKRSRHKPKKEPVLPGRQCYIMMHALTLFQNFIGEPDKANQYLQTFALCPEEKKSLDFVLKDPTRQIFMKEETNQERDRQCLKHAWLWFQKHAQDPFSLSGIAFRLAEMGATRDVGIEHLLDHLTIAEFGSLSRNSTMSWDDDATTSPSTPNPSTPNSRVHRD